jgi:predicted SAM-dependent methyltransferase
VEWIVGPEQSADVKLHSGELDFETMAALFAEAGLVMSPAGFGPVLAQAVGTPNIAVYGRRESFKTADAAGAHLAPTLGIDPDESCDCHSLAHACQKCRADAPKRITLPPAIARVKEFVEQNVERRKQPNIIADSPRVLIFATTFEDCADRANLTDHWIKLHGALNPNCDLLLVDSASPWAPSIATRHSDFVPHPHSAALRSARMVHSFPDNVGHLSRGGRDGWGRAFTYGLQAAIAGRYDYVVHIEGDSLLRLPVRPIIEQMQRENVAVASTPVTGMKNPGSEAGWVETGLMFFRVSYLEQSKFIEQYDWPARQVYPTPEVIVRRLIDDQLRMMPWKAWRSDKNQITHQNVVGLDLDWITHCHNDVWCYDRFLEAALRPKSNVMKVNLGCGDNRLAGWDNHDADVDITKPLPYPDDTVDFVFAEHVVEHVPQKAAFRFFQECRRVLRAGGVMRIAVPAADQIMRLADDDYCAFASKWHPAKGKTRRDALNVIINAHGHEAIWSAASLEAAIYAAGFDTTRLCKPGESEVPELRGVEGHHKMIGQKFNDIETVVCEGYDRS